MPAAVRTRGYTSKWQRWVHHILRIPSVHRVPLDQPIKPSVRCHVSFKPPLRRAKIHFLLAGAAANPSCLTLLKVSVSPATWSKSQQWDPRAGVWTEGAASRHRLAVSFKKRFHDPTDHFKSTSGSCPQALIDSIQASPQILTGAPQLMFRCPRILKPPTWWCTALDFIEFLQACGWMVIDFFFLIKAFVGSSFLNINE